MNQKYIEEYNKDIKYFSDERILIKEAGNSLTAIYLNEIIYSNRSLYSMKPKNKQNLLFLLSCLNSKLLSFYYCENFKSDTNIFPKIRIEQVKHLPIPKATEVEQQKLGLAQKMIYLNKQLAGAKSQAEVSVLTRQIAATDIFIDKLVFALYGLTDDEIATIEKQ